MKKKAKEIQNDLDFQIQFIEDVLNRTPTFIEALVALGELYTKRGLYEKGLEMDLRLSSLRPDCPYVNYNLACSYSLLNHIEEALSTIKRAVDCGYNHFEYLQYDTDLANLRRDERYQEFISTLINKKTTHRPRMP